MDDAPDPLHLLHGAFNRPDAESVLRRRHALEQLIRESLPDLELLELLGEGGTGTVWKARQRKLNRTVALKVLCDVGMPVTDARESSAPPGPLGPEAAARFEREAKALAQLTHPNIVAIHDYGREESFCWLLLEYVEGTTLRELLRSEPCSVEDVLAMADALCEALHAAHSRGIVHRDVKPENVLIDGDGRLKVTDFGLAKVMGETAGIAALTHPRQVLGTFRYMAPEQLDRPQEVDHRADLYSLGVLLYEMLTGEVPVGRFPLPSEASEASEADARMDRVLLRCLQPEAGERYATAADLRSDLGSIARGEGLPVIERPESRWPSATMPHGAWLAPALLVVSMIVNQWVRTALPLFGEEHLTTYSFYAISALPIAVDLVAFMLGALALRKIVRNWPNSIGIAGALIGLCHVPKRLLGIGLTIWLARRLEMEDLRVFLVMYSVATWIAFAVVVLALRKRILNSLAARPRRRPPKPTPNVVAPGGRARPSPWGQ